MCSEPQVPQPLLQGWLDSQCGDCCRIHRHVDHCGSSSGLNGQLLLQIRILWVVGKVWHAFCSIGSKGCPFELVGYLVAHPRIWWGAGQDRLIAWHWDIP
jgi:hypothetical protein